MPDDETIATTLRTALAALLDLAERYEVQIDLEWGNCRSLDQMEADGDLAPQIIQAREALKHG